jgi:hypothetical protein
MIIMSRSISFYDPRTDEERRKYLEHLRSKVNNVSTGGPLNNLLNGLLSNVVK